MRKRKVGFVLFALACVYVVASGGITPLLEDPQGIGHSLLDPILTIRPFDAGLLMIAVVFLSWALLLGETGKGVTRETMLLGVALGSALLTTMFLSMVMTKEPVQLGGHMTGVVALMALLQGFVGLTAATLLLVRKDSRRLSPVPILLNGPLTGLAIFLVCSPWFVLPLES